MAIGFKHGSSGGGILLNFDVVNASSEPSSPRENTIWVSTTWAQNGWTFGPELPLRRSKNKNFATYPYASGTNTSSGVTFTDNGNGTITVNGTASKDVYFRASRATAEEGMFLLPAGTYFLSGCPSGGSSGTYMVQLITMDSALNTVSTIEDYGIGQVFALTEDTLCRMNFAVKSGAKVNGLTVYFQVEKGSAGTSFLKGNANGQVWVKPDNSGAVSFEALKRSGKNSIVLQLGEVYMFTESGGWNRQKTVKVYQYGAWKALEDPSAPETPDSPWDGYYFNNGNQYEGVTGGWGAWSSGATIGDTIAVTNAGASTNNKVDLTNVSKLWFDSPSGSGAFGNLGVLCVTSEKNAASNNIKASVQVRAGRGSLDVSGLTGTYYISLYAGSQGYADVSAIWKE